MKLTDAERAEYLTLTENTYDPELSSEEDLPLMREVRRQVEEEQARAAAVPHTDPPAWAADEEDEDEGKNHYFDAFKGKNSLANRPLKSASKK
jgi:hypothetical protein